MPTSLLMTMAYTFPNSNTSGTSSGSYDSFASPHGNEMGLEVSDYDFFNLNEWLEDDTSTFSSFLANYNTQTNYSTPNVQDFADSGRDTNFSIQDEAMITRNNESGMEMRGIKDKVTFKTKSELIEILDDGFKWRKYGKKKVKNNQYPRNYYKCSIEGCPVKKKVERDNEDRRYVLTTYEGIHNHGCPTI